MNRDTLRNKFNQILARLFKRNRDKGGDQWQAYLVSPHPHFSKYQKDITFTFPTGSSKHHAQVQPFTTDSSYPNHYIKVWVIGREGRGEYVLKLPDD